MRATIRAAAAVLTLIALVSGTVRAAEPQPGAAAAGKFTLTSTDIAPGGKIADAQVFEGFGCKGGNVSPQLSWSGAPADTKSFALLVHDPDAPTGSGWWHWIVYNIPASTTSLAAGAGGAKGQLPAGAVQGRTDFGTSGYGGPCPPPGKPHHYHFYLYALKVAKLDLPADATAAFIGFNVRAQAIGKPAELTGIYGR
jgi:Raf kinase inhibitor-like YbhB/YbcL family protein